MQGKVREHWQELCTQAAVEQDSKKLLKLSEEINRLLLEKQQRLDRETPTSPVLGEGA